MKTETAAPMTFGLTEGQEEAYKKIIGSDKTELALAGYAGTGKTTLCEKIVSSIDNAVLLAPTWKAARVLSAKTGKMASSIHGALYRGVYIFPDGKLKFSDPDLGEDNYYIIDEASMVGRKLYDDFMASLNRKGGKVLWVGDPAQLPPVMEKITPTPICNPDAMLTEIVRTGKDSMIARCAQGVRTKGAEILRPLKAENVEIIKGNYPFDISAFDVVICSTNKNRVKYNSAIMSRDIQSEKLRAGDKLVLQESSNDKYWVNSDIVTVREFEKIEPFTFETEVGFDMSIDCFHIETDQGRSMTILDCLNEETKFKALKNTGIDPNDNNERPLIAFYAHCLTCHKSQGSEFDNVLVDTRNTWWLKEQRQQWIYTAITRAKKTLTILI